jgi:hypothetical protein
MTRTRISFALVGALVVGAGLCAGLARADDPKPGVPSGQKEVKQPFLDALIGTWNVETTGPMAAGKGKSTFAKGVGGTAVLQDYEKKSAMGPYFAHGIYKVSDDDKTLTLWWLDNHGAEPVKFTGALTDTGYDVSGEASGVGVVNLKAEKKGDTIVFTMGMGGQSMVTTYTRAK